VSDEQIEEVDTGIDRALDRAGEQAERDIAEHVPPSFAAVVARARRIDPSTVPGSALERAEGHARSVRSRVSAASRPDDAGLIAPFLAQARADAERDIAERGRLGVPPWRRSASRVRAWSLLGGVMAAAAATILALGLVDGWRATRTEDSARTQSLAGVDTSPDVHEATQNDAAASEPTSVPRRASRASDPSLAPAAPATIVPAVPPGTALVAPSPELAASSLIAPRAGASKVPRDPTLRQLDARAQAALAAGDRELADRLYAQVITRGEQQPLVELAYAERFSLARARGVAQQRVLWRAYLQAFPRGRFADDADAGLCRTAPAQDKTRCWSAYVAQFPTGAYRDHADRWVDSAVARAGGSSTPPE
jgi:hypothetical protein